MHLLIPKDKLFVILTPAAHKIVSHSFTLFFPPLPLRPPVISEFRNLVIEMVLSTDMSSHFQQIKTMKSLLNHADLSVDKAKAMSLILHCCDISHPAKQFDIHHRWTTLLMEEFFRQVSQFEKGKLICYNFSPSSSSPAACTFLFTLLRLNRRRLRLTNNRVTRKKNWVYLIHLSVIEIQLWSLKVK